MQFCSQCGGPVDGNAASCSHCGTPRGAGAVAAATDDGTAAFEVPSFAAAAPSTGPLADTGPFAPDDRYTPPADWDPPTGHAPGTPSASHPEVPLNPDADRRPSRYDPYTGEPIYDDPNGDATGLVASPAAPAQSNGNGAFGYDPLANMDATGVIPAAEPYAAPPPVAAAPPPPPPPPAHVPEVIQAPAHVQEQLHQDFHAAEPGEELNTRPEIMEILCRVLGDRYAFMGEIGAGGMSIVYKLEDTVLQTQVAVKVLYPELAINPEVANRFKNEAVITAKLTGNPYIIKVYDYGYKERIHYIITMFLSGRSLRDEMKHRFSENRKFEWREAAEIMIKVGKALESVHARDVVHRDIKPGNIIFENGQPILIDFGIAKIPQKDQGKEWQVMTQAGMSLGTPHYISPEEAQGLGSTTKSDIYSLGVVFYEMVTGRVPFDGESAQAIMIDHVTKEPDDPTIYNSSLPSHIGQVVLKLLRKDPNQRLSASEMVLTLEEIAGINQRGSSASAQSVDVGDGGGGHSHGGKSSATVMTKNVLKSKKGSGKKASFSPMTAVLLVLALVGVTYALAPQLFTGPAPAQATVEGGGDAPPVDTMTADMDKLYDMAGLDLQKGLYKKSLSEYEKVYLWNPSWREVAPRYQAVDDFLEGKKAYLSGRSRTSFEKAIQYFDKANKALGGKFPMAEEYKIAAQHMSDAIGGEQNAESAESKIASAPNADMKKQYQTDVVSSLWEAQRSYEKVTEQISYEAGAYLSRLAVLEKYLSKVMGVDESQVQRAKDAMRATIDEAMGGLEDDKENLLAIYDWAEYIEAQIFNNPTKAAQIKTDADRIRQEWEAAGRPGPDEDDVALEGTKAAAEEDAPVASPAEEAPAEPAAGTTPTTEPAADPAAGGAQPATPATGGTG